MVPLSDRFSVGPWQSPSRLPLLHSLDTEVGRLQAEEAGLEGRSLPDSSMTIPPSRTSDALTKGRWSRLKVLVARRSSVSFVVAASVANASNLLFHVVVSRVIGPSNYGALSALLGVLVVMSVPLGALQASVTQSVVEQRSASSGGRVGIWRLTKTSSGISLLATILWIAVTPLLADYLKLRSIVPALLLGLWILPSILGTVWQGLLVAEGRYAPVAASLVVGAAFTRLILGYVLGRMGFGLPGAVFATVASTAVTAAILAVALRGNTRTPDNVRVRFGRAILSVVGLGGATVLSSLDGWLARHFLSPSPAGLVAADINLGRIPMFLPGALVLIAFPRMVEAGEGRASARRVVLGTIAAVTGIAGFVALVICLFGSRILDLVYGGSYTDASPFLPQIVLADACVAVISAVIYHQVARKSQFAFMAWIGCALMLLLSDFFHGTATALANVMLVSNAALLVASLAVSLGSVAADGRRERPMQPESTDKD